MQFITKKEKSSWNKKEIRAINESIEHWIEILCGVILNHLSGLELMTDISMDGDSCPLCNLCKTNNNYEISCIYCPIGIVVNAFHCIKTPFYSVRYAMFNDDYEKVVREIKKEIIFLEKVLNYYD
jgi:hypothetical protein